MPSRDPSLSLQKMLVGALKNQTPAGANIFDRVPSSDPFPRVTVGEGQTLKNAADCYDGSESFLQIDVWSRAVGYPETKQIADRIREILDDQILPLDGHTMELMEVGSAVYSREADGLTSRARMDVRVLSQPSD